MRQVHGIPFLLYYYVHIMLGGEVTTSYARSYVAGLLEGG